MNSFLLAMEDMALAVGRMSKRFKYAEGWRRHLHFGFCAADVDPLARGAGKELPGEHRRYERSLEEAAMLYAALQSPQICQSLA